MGSSVTSAAQVLEQYGDFLKLHKKRSPKTVDSYIRTCTDFLQFALKVPKQPKSHHPDSLLEMRLGAEPIIEHMAPYIQQRARILSANSQAQTVSALRTFLIWLEQSQYIPAGTHLQFAPVKRTRKLVRVFDLEDLPRLQAHIKKRPPEEQLLFELLYGMGLRIEEALLFRPDQIVENGAAIRFRGKGTRMRQVPTTPCFHRLIQIIQTSPSPQKNPAQVSPWGSIRSTRGLRHWVEQWGNSIGLELHPHKLRHSIATHLLQRGANLVQVQKLLGHRNLETTQRYAHLNADDLVRQYDQAQPPKLKKPSAKK